MRRSILAEITTTESGPLGAVHLSRHKWPGGLVNKDSAVLSTPHRGANAFLYRTVDLTEEEDEMDAFFCRAILVSATKINTPFVEDIIAPAD